MIEPRLSSCPGIRAEEMIAAGLAYRGVAVSALKR